MWAALIRLHNSIKARALRYWRAREVVKALTMVHAQELAQTPVNMWAQRKTEHAKEIQAVRAGQFPIVDRRSWAYPYIPEALHRLNQPILKNTPYNLRRFTETPIPRRALNLVKNALLSLRWRVAIDDKFDQEDPELLKKVEIAEYCLEHPNLTDSWRTLMEAVVEDFLIGGYGTIEPQITPDYRRPLKMWAVDGCVDDKTEVLTEKGWVKWPEVTKEDVFATRSKSGKLEYQKATSLQKYYWDGKLLKFDNREVEMVLTPNHRVLGRRSDFVWKKKGDATREWKNEEILLAAEVAKFERFSGGDWPFKIPMTSRWVGKLPTNCDSDGYLSLKLRESTRVTGELGKKGFQPSVEVVKDHRVRLEDWVSFLGIYLAEGCCSGVRRFDDEQLLKEKKVGLHYVGSLAASADTGYRYAMNNRLYTVTVAQKKEGRHYEDIRRLMSRLPWNFQELERGGFSVTHKGLHDLLFPLGNKYIKYVPDWIKRLPPKYIEMFIEWACKGDGYFRNGVRTYVTTSKSLANDMQELFQKIGKSASISFTPAGKREMFGKVYKKAPCYFVQERKRKYVGVGGAKEVPYKGFVYCASVPNGTLYMRRHGFPFWTGNSTIRIYADWTEGTPERQHYAQLTGLKGERGIISFLDDELVYIRDNVRSSTPFGFGRMECAFLTCNAFLGAQDMSARAGADQIHKTWLWWPTNVPPGHMETVRRHIQNEAEGQAKVSLMSGLPKPEVVEVNPVLPEDLLLEWQDFLIRIMAAAFELSPMALGLERQTNRSTAAVMAEQDFNSAVVPAARKLEEALTRLVLHRGLGWRELKFEFVGLEDPDELIQVQLTQKLYMTNAITPDEIRERMQIGEPLPGGWGKLTFAQMQLVTQAAVGKGGGGAGAGVTGMGGGMGAGGGGGVGMGNINAAKTIEGPEDRGVSSEDSPLTPEEIAQLDPQTLQMYREAGLLPQQDPSQDDSQKPGILQTLSEELIEYFEWLEQEEDENKTDPAKVTTADQKEQAQKFKKRQHQLTQEERVSRGRDFRTNTYENQNAGYRGPFPKRKLLPPAKKQFTGRTR
jgi:hypothetical protein